MKVVHINEFHMLCRFDNLVEEEASTESVDKCTIVLQARHIVYDPFILSETLCTLSLNLVFESLNLVALRIESVRIPSSSKSC